MRNALARPRASGANARLGVQVLRVECVPGGAEQVFVTVQVYIDKHPDLFATGAERSDLRLFLLCAILGVTGWASLCRLLRAETMKLRELDYVQAATAFGVSHLRIMVRHIFPNVVHLIIITTVLDFSHCKVRRV